MTRIESEIILGNKEKNKQRPEQRAFTRHILHSFYNQVASHLLNMNTRQSTRLVLNSSATHWLRSKHVFVCDQIQNIDPFCGQYSNHRFTSHLLTLYSQSKAKNKIPKNADMHLFVFLIELPRLSINFQLKSKTTVICNISVENVGCKLFF